LDAVGLQIGVIGSEGSPADILGWESKEAFPKLGVKVKVLDGFSLYLV